MTIEGGFPKVLNELVEKISRFPGVGKRSAERIAVYILKMNKQYAYGLAKNIVDAHKTVKPCRLCNNFSTEELCPICADPKRSKRTVCIVEEPKDVLAIEKTSKFRGVYYVLLGSISPLEGMGPKNLNLRKLINRAERGDIDEIIIATDADSEGEITAHYLIEKFSRYKIRIYRISIGIPLGTQIEYIDSATLGKAIEEKKTVAKIASALTENSK